jgi:fagellar hook-basal body proteins
MLRGIYCSNTGLNALQKEMEVIANNLANVNTDGYKQEKVSIKTFKNEMDGVIANKITSDFSDGTENKTDNIYNFAIEGDAFFKLKTDEGYLYTRNGSFNVDNEGYLLDSYGHKVEGTNGEVKMANGAPDQDFYLASFKDKGSLTRTEGGFLASDPTAETKAENIKVSPGFLEASNVDMVQNMTDMISVSRSFALNSRMITSQDEMLKKAVEEVGALK